MGVCFAIPSEDDSGVRKDHGVQQGGIRIHHAPHHHPSIHPRNLPIPLHPLPHLPNPPPGGPSPLRPHTLRGPPRVARVPPRRPLPPPHQGPLRPPLLPPLPSRRPRRRPLHPTRPPRHHPLPPLRRRRPAPTLHAPPRHHPLRLRRPLRLLPPPARPRLPRPLRRRQTPPPRRRLALEVYLMAVASVGIVVSVAEERTGWDAIWVGSALMEGNRACGWVLSGLFVFGSSLIGWKLERLMDENGIQLGNPN
ncbi:Titin protein [Spatholobus suberectus]|nr:Titin protein [Spatholobus suberectus]